MMSGALDVHSSVTLSCRFISEKMDGQGNYTLGIKEQIIFPEIEIDKNPRIHGIEITFVTTAKTDEEAHALLKAFGLPFKKHNN